MRFPEGGMSPDDIGTALESMRGDDADWKAGRTWSLVYSAGAEHDSVLKDAYLRFFSENGLSPSAFPSLARMEREVVWAMLDRHAQTVAGFRQVAQEAAHHLEVEMLQGCTQIPTQRELRFRRASSAVTEDIDARFDDLLEAAPPQGRDLRPYRSPTRRVSLLAMKFWYPVVAHPAAGQGPWFSHDDDGLVHRAENHPAGPSDAPVYRVVFGLAYDALGDNARPMFQITGSIVSPGEGHPAGRSPDPWYQVRD